MTSAASSATGSTAPTMQRDGSEMRKWVVAGESR